MDCPPDSSATSTDVDCMVQERKALQRVIKTAQYICGAAFPSLQGIYKTRVTKRAHNITKDTTHPQHTLFALLPSGRCYRSVKARITRLKKLFSSTGHQAAEWLCNTPMTTLYTQLFNTGNYICTMFHSVNYIHLWTTFALVLHDKPILERYRGTQPLRTILFHVLLVSVLYELCATVVQLVCVQLFFASSLM